MSDTPVLRLYLWPHRVLYLGLSPDNEMHRHHAAQLCVSLDGMLRIDDGSKQIESVAVFIPPDHPHRIDAGEARIAALYFEPESDEYEALTMPSPATGESDRLNALQPTSIGVAALQDQYAAGGTADDVWAMCMIALGMGSSAARPVQRDSRIERVIRIIRDEPGADHSVDRLAEAVHLSAGRLSHLFREHVGVAIRRFIAWSRMRQVVNLVVQGATLTEAAHAAGFSDAAHMSNTFRQMFGFAPSALLAKQVDKDIQLVD